MRSPMRLLAALPVLAAGLSLSGCLITPSEHVDPFAGVAQAQKDKKYELTAAMLPSENTVKSGEYISKYARTYHAGFTEREALQPLTSYSDMLEKRFARVVRISRMDEAPQSGADVVVLLDVYAKLPLGPFHTKVDAQLSLMSPQGTVYETFNSHGDEPAPWTGPPLLKEAVQDTVVELDRDLATSASLTQLESKRINPSAAGAAPAVSIHSDVDSPDFRVPQRPDDLAVVVGIENYAGLPSATYAERDAKAMKAHLLALGVPERNIRVLVGAQATLGGLAKNLETWLPSQVKEDSTVYFYYSGHGAPDVKTGQAYLLPWDGDAAFLEKTAYPTKRLYRSLNALPAKRVVVALDSCFSGAGGRSVLAKGLRPLVTTINTGTPTGKLTVLTASAGSEVTGADDTQGHGLFTYYLLKGLDGAAKRADGRVTVGSLYDYLVPRVRDAASRANRDQTPQLLRGSDRADFALR